MCGGGGGNTVETVRAPEMSGAKESDTYRGPPGPGSDIGQVLMPAGGGNYKQTAQALLSTGQTYGQLASGLAGLLSNTQQQGMAPPPAPQSAFNGGVGQYLAQMGSQPIGQSPAMSVVEAFEGVYDPRSSATDMLMSYEPAYPAKPLSYYTPHSMARLQGANQEAPAPAAAPSRQSGMTHQDIIDQRRNKTPYQRMQDMRRQEALGQRMAR